MECSCSRGWLEPSLVIWLAGRSILLIIEWMPKRDMEMKREKYNKEKNRGNKSQGMLIVYIILALILIVMQILIWICGKNLFMLIFHNDDVSVSFFTKVRSAVISVVVLVAVFWFAVRVVPSFPNIIRRMKYDNQRNQERYNAFLGTYFSDDDKVRDHMLFVLQEIDHKRYSVADEICVKLLEKRHIPEEQAVILYCRMICRGEMGNTKEAIEFGERALSLRKGYIPALLETAGFCIKLNKMADAEKYLLEIRESGQLDLRVSRMLYQVYTVRNRHKEALAEALRWEQLEPDSLEAAACVCGAAHKCGETDIVNSRLQRCASEHYEGYDALRKEIRGY